MIARADFPVRPSIVFVGSVESSAVTLISLLRAGADVRAVLGLDPSAASRVSGYVHLRGIAEAHRIPYADFVTINDLTVIGFIESHSPDFLWVIGLSQLIGPELRSLSRYGAVGFHPTRLPVGRGRAAMAWSVLADVPLAATFFLIDDGIDSGPILAQFDVPVSSEDDVTSRYRKLYQAMELAVDTICQRFTDGLIELTPQDAALATFLGARRPSDGILNWEGSSEVIIRLVRASRSPHPGAWTHDRMKSIRIDQCVLCSPGRYLGVPGRILDVEPDGSFVVATGDGAVRIIRYEVDEPWIPKPGTRLGFAVQHELHSLRQRVADLETIVARIIREDERPQERES
jgi:methionyl-tRNA formyltransferase